MTPDQRAILADSIIAILFEEAASVWPKLTIDDARAIFKSIETKRRGNLAFYLRARIIEVIEEVESRKSLPKISTNPNARALPPPHLCGGKHCEECGKPGALHARTCSCQD